MPAKAEQPLPVIDARGLRCPWPVLRAQRAMRAGDGFLLLADDPVTLTDVPLAAAAVGWTAIVEQGSEPIYRFSIMPPG